MECNGSRTQTAAKPQAIWQWMAHHNDSFVDDSLLKMILACAAILFNVAAAYTVLAIGFIINW